MPVTDSPDQVATHTNSIGKRYYRNHRTVQIDDHQRDREQKGMQQ